MNLFDRTKDVVKKTAAKIGVLSRQMGRRILFRKAFAEVSKQWGEPRFRRRRIAHSMMHRSWRERAK